MRRGDYYSKNVFHAINGWQWSVHGPNTGTMGSAPSEEEAHRRADEALSFARTHPLTTNEAQTG